MCCILKSNIFYINLNLLKEGIALRSESSIPIFDILSLSAGIGYFLRIPRSNSLPSYVTAVIMRKNSYRTLRTKIFTPLKVYWHKCIAKKIPSTFQVSFLPYFNISTLPSCSCGSVIRSNASCNHIVSIFFSVHFSSPNPDSFFCFTCYLLERRKRNRTKKLSKGKPLQFRSRGMLQL